MRPVRLLCLAAIWFVLLPMPVRAAPPAVSADAAVLMDAATGQVLYAKNAHQRRAPASTTKILTALLALQRGNLARPVRIPAEAARTPGSSMHLRAGQRFTLADLLEGLLLPSGNDASVAIARAVGGSVPSFVREMNRTARKLGALDSHFVNPSGLSAPAHYSTAYDLALIARTALRDPRFAALVGSRQRRVRELRSRRERTLSNTNRLLWTFPGADGVKTGTTRAAGQCLVASATRHGWRLIAVVLHADQRWSDAARLLDWGFATFVPVRAAPAGVPLASVAVHGGAQGRVALIAASPLDLVVPRREAQEVRVRLDVPKTVRAPILRGEPLGLAYLEVGGSLRQRVLLAAARAVPRVGVLQRVLIWLERAATFLA